ncbi:MAG: hypothetical protein RIC55_28150 [Pirellulaceae bacterium]
MAAAEQPQRKSVLESPWYWLYVFAAGALIALMLLGWKFGPRQAQIENKFLGHQAAAEREAGVEAGERESLDRELSTPEHTMINLTPLYVILAVVFVAAWIAVWRQVFLRRTAGSRPDADARPTSANVSNTQVKT